MNKFYLCIVLLITTNQLNAEESRFQRLVRLYNNYEYLRQDRSVSFKYEKVKDFLISYQRTKFVFKYESVNDAFVSDWKTKWLLFVKQLGGSMPEKGRDADNTEWVDGAVRRLVNKLGNRGDFIQSFEERVW